MIERTVIMADKGEDISAAEARARMIRRLYRKDDEDDIDWITVNGTHIPLKEGKAIGGPLKGKKFENAKTEETPKKAENKGLTAEKHSAKITDKQKYYAAANGYGGNSGDNGGSNNGRGGYKRPNNPKSKIRSYSKATTIAEAEAEARQIFAEVDYSKFADVETARRVNDTLLSVYKQYPYNASYISTEANLVEGRNAVACRDYVICYFGNIYDTESKLAPASQQHAEFKADTIMQLANYQKRFSASRHQLDYLYDRIKESRTQEDFNYYRRIYANEYDKYCKIENIVTDYKDRQSFERWFAITDGMEIEGTIAHELGHLLADRKFGQLNPWAYKGDQDIAEDNRNFVEQCFDYAKQSGDIYSISRYAKENEFEFFAECFCMYFTGQDLPKYLVDMIVGVLQ